MHRIARMGSRFGFAMSLAFALTIAGAKVAAAATATTCSPATSGAAHVLQWLDITGYPGTGTPNSTFSFVGTLAVGATATATFDVLIQ